MRFTDSYVGKLREVVGERLLLLIGSRIFIKDDAGRILMQKRSDFDAWGFLGGLAEAGEATIRREVYEESGLTPGQGHAGRLFWRPHARDADLSQWSPMPVLLPMFRTREFSGDMQIRDDETLEFAWQGLDQFPPMLDSIQFGLECLQEFKRTGQFQVR